jgi:xanthine dehydrogenase accessory factor
MPRFLDWAEAAAALGQRGEAYVLITVLGVMGSAPRDSGTKMLVSAGLTVDTIGGGHLEYTAINRARELLLTGENTQHLEEFPLGAKLGQCCGGRVTLLYECFASTATQVALFGAGHVGRALVEILAHLPLRVRWIDSRIEQFPETIPSGVTRVVVAHPEDEVVDLPPGAFVLVMTHLHPLDYAITEAVLRRGDAGFLGVIGSETKARRFRLRLERRGFSREAVSAMHCPIGSDVVPGKRPMEVAVSIAAQVIAHYHQSVRGTKPEAPRLAATALLTLLQNNEDNWPSS